MSIIYLYTYNLNFPNEQTVRNNFPRGDLEYHTLRVCNYILHARKRVERIASSRALWNAPCISLEESKCAASRISVGVRRRARLFLSTHVPHKAVTCPFFLRSSSTPSSRRPCYSTFFRPVGAFAPPRFCLVIFAVVWSVVLFNILIAMSNTREFRSKNLLFVSVYM